MTVHVERFGPVGVVTIDRPDVRNAVDRVTADALADAFRTLDGDDDVLVGILTGAGSTFCSGADLGAMTTDRSNRMDPDPDADGPMGPTRLDMSIPTIAAIEGYAVAGGLELACWCDLRVVADDATLGVFCRRWGVPLVDGGTVRLPRLIGESRALDLILTGRPVGAAEALAMGLANRVVPTGTALASALELAESIAATPQDCMRGDRASVIESHGLPIPDALSVEFGHGLESLASPELGEGLAAFQGGAGRGGTAR